MGAGDTGYNDNDNAWDLIDECGEGNWKGFLQAILTNDEEMRFVLVGIAKHDISLNQEEKERYIELNKQYQSQQATFIDRWFDKKTIKKILEEERILIDNYLEK